MIVVTGEEQGKQRNTGDSIMEQKIVSLKDAIRHDWDKGRKVAEERAGSDRSG